jgi:hypothetical protein
LFILLALALLTLASAGIGHARLGNDAPPTHLSVDEIRNRGGYCVGERCYLDGHAYHCVNGQCTRGDDLFARFGSA